MTVPVEPAVYSAPLSVDETAVASSDLAVQLRPTNLSRTAFHLAAGGLSLAMVRLMPSWGWLVAAAAMFALVAWTCEVTRRMSPAVNAALMRLFGRVAHAHEWQEVNSATWYATAIALMALVMPLPAAEVGVVVLAVADPMAGFVGRRFGRHRLASGRSLEGAAAFVVTGTLAALGWMHVTGTFEGSRVALALVAGVSGAVIELVVSKVDDNLAIPLGTSAVVALAALV